ncbi:glycosyltransferase family 39 protein [Candidatus Woesebacteria bacterium]|nr:glycosyltransferase family 39 protein [Candidatus Woesebacteria bacterium]
MQRLRTFIRLILHSRFLLPGLLILAFSLRLPLLSGSFWLDEAAQALESVRPWSEQHRIDWDFHPPLFHYIVHSLAIFAHAEWWLRLSSLLSGVITVWATYRLCLRMGSKRVAMIAAFLLATSSFHIFYSQELRPYALATMFAVLSWVLLFEVIAIPRLKQGVALAVVSILGMYSLYLYPFILLAQVLYVARFHPRVLKFLIQVDTIVAIAFLPWLPSFLRQLSVGTGWATQVTGWSQIVATPQLKALPLVGIKFLIGPVEYRELGLLAPGVWLMLALSALVGYQAFRNPKSKAAFFWLVIPILTAFLLSFVVPILQPKRVLLCLPAFFIMLAFGIEQLSTFSKKLALLAASAFVVSNLATSLAYYRTPSFQREPWKATILQIKEDCNSSSCIVLFAFDAPFAPWKWYASSLLPIAHLDSIQVTDREEARLMVSKASGMHKVYLFDYLQDITDPQRLILSELELQGYIQLPPIDAGSVGFVRRFTTAD